MTKNQGVTKVQSPDAMKIKLVYRNYKPLHQIYESLVTNPPPGVEYIVPEPKTKLQKFYPLSKKLRYFAPTRNLIHLVEKVVFLPKKNKDTDDTDVYHYVNIIDTVIPRKPYVVDIEHAASLTTFTHHKKRMEKVRKFLLDDNCKSVTCLSQAAKRTLEELIGPDFDTIQRKVNVIYPALKSLGSQQSAEHSIIENRPEVLKALFVGNQAYLKGLEELLLALEQINKEKDPRDIMLYVVSHDAEPLLEKYRLPNVQLFLPSYNKEEIINKFFMPADVFVMPTKEDTFGMAILDALVCGTPVVCTKQFALPELVTDGVDGVLLEGKWLLDETLIPSQQDMAELNSSNVNQQLVEGLKKTLEGMLSDRKILRDMRGKGTQKFTSGHKFSVDTRNKALLDLYKAAVRS